MPAKASVVYLHGKNGNPKLVPCCNEMMVDAGYAWVRGLIEEAFADVKPRSSSGA